MIIVVLFLAFLLRMVTILLLLALLVLGRVEVLATLTSHALIQFVLLNL